MTQIAGGGESSYLRHDSALRTKIDMFPSYRNQSVDFLASQVTGFYMMGTLVVKELITVVTFLILLFSLVMLSSHRTKGH